MPKRNRAISAPNEETVTGLEPVEPVQKTKKGRTLSQATTKKSKKAKPSRKLGRVNRGKTSKQFYVKYLSHFAINENLKFTL